MEKAYLLNAIAAIDWHYFDIEHPEERYIVENLFEEFLWHCKVEYDGHKGYIDFQMEDWRACLWNYQAFLMRARGGSKTRDLALLIIFFALSGLNCCWRTTQSNQLLRLYEISRSDDWIYSRKPPDLRWCVSEVPTEKSKGTKFIELVQGRSINCAALTENSAVSGRFNIIAMDEMARLKNKRYWTDFVNTTSDDINYYARCYGFSTPLISSPFQREWDNINKMRKVAKAEGRSINFITLMRDWSQIPWLALAYKTALEGGMSDFDLNLNFRCIFDFEKINLFPNILKETWPEPPFDPNQLGVDFGIPEHHVIGIYMKPDRTECWILTEDDVDEAKNPKSFEIVRGYRVEIERGGWNEKRAKAFKRRFPLCGMAFWGIEEKLARLDIARKMLIHIDPRKTPHIASDMRRVHMDPRNKTYIKNKAYPMHYFDAFLHAIGAAWTSTYSKSDRHYKLENQILRDELKREQNYSSALLEKKSFNF